jgi:membrane-associated phospholipid phosphatase
VARLSGPTPFDVQHSQQLAQALDRHPQFHQLASLIAHSGDSPIWIIALGLVLFLPIDPHWKYEAFVGLAGILLTALVVQSIKWSVRRPRPVGEWGQGYRRLDPHSFPSGHAARAAFLALAAFYSLPLWAGILFTIWAVLVCFARVSLRVHYLSDVMIGAACGIIGGLALAVYVGF